MQPHYWWRRTALAVVLIAACLPFAARLIAGPPGADVHVRWQASLGDAARRALEARYHLVDGQELETYTWRYDLTDPSRDNIRALVADPAVADTGDIDRPKYSLTPQTTRTARRLRFSSGGDTLVVAGDWVAMAMGGLAALLVGLGLFGRAESPQGVVALFVHLLLSLTAAARRIWATLQRFLVRGIPEIDAGTAGIFRIVLGVLLLAFFYSRRVDASWLSATFDLEVEGALHAWILDRLRDRPLIVNGLTAWMLTMGAAFTIGIFTRLAYGLFVAGAILWAYVAMSLDSTHPHSTLILALVALLPSRWGDAYSVDSWLRRVRGQSAVLLAGKHYGYSVWIPGLVFGVGYAAAAYAKLYQGPQWILNGTVKYYFITDSGLAPFQWGLHLVQYPRFAIVASFFAVATEAIVLTAAFQRNEWYRLAMGFAALGLIGGFYVFMGHFWPGWWILLLGFLPWERLSRFSPSIPSVIGTVALAKRSPTMAQATVMAAVIVQQIVVSAIRIERAPMFSYYPMYSGWYSGREDYEASRPLKYRLIASTDQGDVELRCQPYEEFVTRFKAALDGSREAKASVWYSLGACMKDLAPVHAVRLEGDRSSFDFDRLEFFSTRAAVILGPLPAGEGGIPSRAH